MFARTGNLWASRAKSHPAKHRAFTILGMEQEDCCPRANSQASPVARETTRNRESTCQSEDNRRNKRATTEYNDIGEEEMNYLLLIIGAILGWLTAELIIIVYHWLKGDFDD